MNQLYYSKLSQTFYALRYVYDILFISKLTEIHYHNTRNTKLLTYFIPDINKNFIKNRLSYRGSILWVQINAKFKGRPMQSVLFEKNFKKHVLSLQV